jgi:hypothetical protein
MGHDVGPSKIGTQNDLYGGSKISSKKWIHPILQGPKEVLTLHFL